MSNATPAQPALSTTASEDGRLRAPARRSWLSHATEPHILFPALAVLVLVAVWGTTLSLMKVERTTAERAAVASTQELTETYEAQVLRALREIDQTLKFVKYAYELRDKPAVLQDLKARALLPPDLLFVVSIADRTGEVVASTQPALPTNVADQDYFQTQPETDILSVGHPRQSPGSREWKLHFSRRLNATDGRFAGIVVVSVDAAYFVSGYESSKHGEHGVVGILGPDGIFRARRSGETVSAGDRVPYAWVVPAPDEAENAVTLTTNSWDDVRRYTSARRLFGYPLAVIVGLSADEQLAPADRNVHTYMWRASAGSLVLLLVIGVLWRMSQQLASSRQRAVEEHIAHAERIEYLAYHDGLTKLANRSLFSKLLGQSISQAHRRSSKLALLFLDLDRFKSINDTLGHDAGDQLLQEVATRLKACLRDSDTIARMGGDEFVVLLPDIDEEKYVATVAQNILGAVARPYILQGQEFRITTSAGISIYPRDGRDELTLTKSADTAMYRAKEEGKNKFRFYSDDLNAASRERLALESGLRQALERGEFQLHYHPKQDIGTGRITGVEALLRWEHPELGTVAPMRFIPLAEDTGLIVPIGNWVLETACLQNVAWQNAGLPPLTMAVKLTARQFYDDHLLADLTDVLAATGMDAHMLELEIHESLLMRDIERNLHILIGIRNLGIRIAIDDFGIGHSSLSTLRQFPLDTIKIDRSFIRDVTSSGGDKSLTTAIIAMGRTLSLTVVTQGVETKAQADFLRENARGEFQGFYLNLPMPADRIGKMLRAQSEVAASDVGEPETV